MFIFKYGRVSYTEVNDFGAINLSRFLLKALEMLIDCESRESL